MVGLASAIPLLLAVTGPADGPLPAESEAERRFGLGVAAVELGQWQEAQDHFLAVLELEDRQTVRLNLAGVQAKIGRLVAAREGYRYLLSNLEPSLRLYRSTIVRILDSLEKRIPKVRFQLQDIAAEHEVLLDGELLPSEARAGTWVDLDPGPHRVQVLVEGSVRTEVDFVLEEGARNQVAVARFGPKPDEDKGEDLWASPWFWGVIGVVVVGAATGAALAVTESRGPAEGSLGRVVLE